MSASSVAVIDVGSNSVNLLVIDAQGTEVTRTVVTTRLGDQLHATGSLSDEAISRTVGVIATHVDTARSHNVDVITIVGTAACRRASNTQQLSDAIFSKVDIALRILTEQEEASFAFEGAIAELPEVVGPTLVIDIGGASTEYTVGFMQAEQSVSIPFGAVTGTASHLVTNPPRPEDLTNLIGAVADELEEIARTYPAMATPARVIGTAGTIVTIAAVEIGTNNFDDPMLHGFVLERDAAEDVFRTLATEPLADRLLNPGITPDRADIIVAGCCILVATMRRLKLNSITVSTRGLLDGVAANARLSS
jgi:exopolyphosphatase/guanosine-5'-triphosphate,3'-diphosphate pyrophosphatase